MQIKLFNSLGKNITELNLEEEINIYLCGPTVYDHIHLGNLRPIIIFDVLIRLFTYLKKKINYVNNITDIDDKIINKAEQQKKTEKEISNHYIKSYFKNLSRYNILFANYYPRVTNYLPEIKQFIADLIKKGYAYQYKDEIFFKLDNIKEYGKLSGQNLQKLKRVRIIQDNKNNKNDFVLWKKTEKGVKWISDWGEGRPGWHTECVVFINQLFKQKTISIHGGGNDLIFAHHENERIQYLLYNNKELSKIWLHIAHINLNNEKMSKSIGNIISAKKFYDEYGSNVFRFLVLNTSYRQVIYLNNELIENSKNYLQKIINLLKKIKFYIYINKLILLKDKSEISNLVINKLLEDLNTIKVFYFLDKNIEIINNMISQNTQWISLSAEINSFFFILEILGFKFDLSNYDFNTMLLINNWIKYKNIKDYIQADIIRNKLQKKGIL